MDLRGTIRVSDFEKFEGVPISRDTVKYCTACLSNKNFIYSCAGVNWLSQCAINATKRASIVEYSKLHSLLEQYNNI